MDALFQVLKHKSGRERCWVNAVINGRGPPRRQSELPWCLSLSRKLWVLLVENRRRERRHKPKCSQCSRGHCEGQRSVT
jgi:hypothetical protein